MTQMSSVFLFADWFSLLLLLVGAMSLALFLVMGFDKLRARRGGRRVPEKRLFLLALLGGAWGGWLGMYAFRHKTRHWYFKFGFPLISMVQAVLLIYLNN